MSLMLSLSTPETIWCAAVVFVAACVRGFSGFGFTAILMTGLTPTLPISQIVPMSIALEIAASAGQASGILRNVHWRKLGILLLAGFVGTPLGVYALGAMADQMLRLIVLIFILGSSAYLIWSRRPPACFGLSTYAGVGFAVGVINGATALSGLVLALFFSLSGDQPAEIRATMIAYLFVADLWAGGVLLASGFYAPTTMMRALVALPILALGIWLGTRLFSSTTPGDYKRVVLWLLVVLSGSGLALTLGQAFV